MGCQTTRVLGHAIGIFGTIGPRRGLKLFLYQLVECGFFGTPPEAEATYFNIHEENAGSKPVVNRGTGIHLLASRLPDV